MYGSRVHIFVAPLAIVKPGALRAGVKRPETSPLLRAGALSCTDSRSQSSLRRNEMRRHSRAFVAGAILALLPWAPPLSAAQTAGAGAAARPAIPAGPAPRTANGKPDLSGVWMPPYVPDMSRVGRGPQAELPFSPAGLQDWKTYDAANGDYTGSCLPFGLTRSINAPNPFQIMQHDRYIAFLFEVNNWFHVVPIGVDHPKNPEPTWFGNSVGRWDGDTLVVDTIGFNGYTRLDTIGHPHSDALHLTQTFLRTDAGHIAYTVIVDDPKTYTQPWKNVRTFTALQTDLIEYSCEENNKDLREGHIKAWTPPWVKKPSPLPGKQ